MHAPTFVVANTLLILTACAPVPLLPVPLPVSLPMYPEDNEHYLYSYNYRAHRGNAFHPARPQHVAAAPATETEKKPDEDVKVAATAKEEEKQTDKTDWWNDCYSAHVHAYRVGSPTLYQCAAIACARGQTPEYRYDTLRQCEALEDEARKGGGDLRGW
ncbi:hypothetical protein HDV00_006337 [Rhizophlyctis rosea]|nr:hypothetical protein HDV00_006337 [Rhizophlyctis rosea]